jgi:hypothetical protein
VIADLANALNGQFTLQNGSIRNGTVQFQTQRIGCYKIPTPLWLIKALNRSG